ncbi:MAG: DUF1631 family protein [Marinobacter sp.]|uniref:DUF1631 family protein n=1 Tax=Marinobacter sp. TaxID=50741 RepID=UPI00299E6CED|nr:DUF1631 family protein [Marinobacter sp.]MDX1755737.1 DUF1631 family protein [Marinobacter sp.]
MVQNRSPNAGFKQDAIIVTRGLPPGGCVIRAIGNHGETSPNQGSTALTITTLTSPSARAHFQKGQAIKADLYLFPHQGNSDDYIHVCGLTTPTKDGDLILICENAVNAADSVPGMGILDSTLLNSGASILSDPSALGALKQLYQQHISRMIKHLLYSFFEGAHTGIDQELEAAAEIREINRLKDMRFLLGSREAQIVQDFTAQFQEANQHLRPENAPAKSSELTVLQKTDFEDWLTLQTVASQVASTNTLFILNQLLNQLSFRDINDAINPISPWSLCHCLQFALDRLGIEPRHRRILYAAFETSLKDVWRPAADSLVKDLFRGGLHALNLINLPPNWSQRETEGVTAAETRAQNEERPGGTSVAGDVPGAPTDLPSGIGSRSVIRMMRLQRDAAHASDEWPATNPKLSQSLKPHRSDLIQSLKQAGPSMQAAIRNLASLDADLADALDESAWDQVELVDRLFSSLEKQPGLAESLRGQLEKLRLPVFEMLLQAPDFLDQDHHITREIVNDLMRLCLAERSSSKNLEETVATIIDELMQSEEPDEARYQAIGKKLKHLVERQDRSFIRNAERISKTLEGKQRLKEAQNDVRRRLNAMLGNSEVPTVLLELLESGWEQLIVLASLREGPKSQGCTELLNVIDQLRLWLVPGKVSAHLAFERELESDALLGLVERELRNLGEVARVREVVSTLTDQLRHHKEVTTVFLTAYPPGHHDSAAVPETSVDGRWSRRARQIQVGDWVEVKLDNGELRRMRLVWGGEDVFRFVFLSPRGLGEESYGFSEFVAKLANGDAMLVDQGDIPFVDQALFDVLQDVYRKLNFEATHDALTGCLLRHEFEKHLSQTLGDLSGEEACVLIAFDIDEFKVINTSYGTDAGDALLKRCATLLQEACTELPLETPVGRLGGNEFAVVAHPMTPEDSQGFADRVRQQFETETFRHGEGEYTCTLSASVCPVEDVGVSAGSLLSEASNSLKAVKRLGGNRVEIRKAEDQEDTAKGIAWVSRIDSSIRDGSLYLRAQKIVALAEDTGSQGNGDRYELLLGLTDASGREISPQGYIEAAEQFRRSSRVDLWVVDEVLNWMTHHPGEMSRIHTLNVNLSGSSLSDDTFLYELEYRLKRHRELTPKLCFEVTETSAVASLHYAADFMSEMKRLHCRFALDDFGTGLSSYAYLQRLPVDFVKIDGVFVKDMTTNPTNHALVRSINELSHFLGMQTIAEYVEDLEIMDALRQIQVDFAQGYGIAKPRRLDRLVAVTAT